MKPRTIVLLMIVLAIFLSIPILNLLYPPLPDKIQQTRNIITSENLEVRDVRIQSENELYISWYTDDAGTIETIACSIASSIDHTGPVSLTAWQNEEDWLATADLTADQIKSYDCQDQLQNQALHFERK